jgi:DNA-binding MltR family transcriptional regulator
MAGETVFVGDKKEFEATITELAQNTDAGHALVTCAIINNWLEKLLITKMNPISNAVAKRIFGNYGALYELAPKADVAFAFGLIAQDILADLRILKDIRNDFAHTEHLIHFDSSEISAHCRKFNGWKKDAMNRKLFAATAQRVITVLKMKTDALLLLSALTGDPATPSPSRKKSRR